MQNFVPIESVVVVRDGKRKTPKLGVSFPFTDAEITHLQENRPEAIRKPTNETGSAEPDHELSDEEVEAANEDAIEAQHEQQIKTAGEKALAAHGAGKAVAAAKAKRAAKVDDL